MKNAVCEMEKNLTDEERQLLKSIYAPQVVATGPCDACMNMCVTEDGEIRIYGAINKNEPEDIGTPVYISSTDCGLSWKTHLTPKGAIGAAGVNPKTKRYISVHPHAFRPDLKKENQDRLGTWAVISDKGLDDADCRYVKLSDKQILILKLPFYLESCGRWFIFGGYMFEDMSDRVIIVFYSDDDGETWSETVLEKSAPEFEVKPPHKGVRWQEHSCEPTVVELDGELVMLVRTSQNYYYMYRSCDCGETWQGPWQSDFHGTSTMPVLHKLSDGRIVLFWCNTQPMPELDHKKTYPPLSDDEIAGHWEDVFTNRDANHLAISEDNMKTWIGFRELFLNSIRNYADFRSIGGVDSRDKSVHQAQISELPYNKLLIHFGQNRISSKVVILDIDWLYEKGRFENFKGGLENVSTQMYIKSNLGGYRGFSGHCAYNRTNGALLVPDPSGNFREVLQLCRNDDERLVYKKQGVVWNFPASLRGKVEIELCVKESGVRISLTDHWYNPTDETVASEAHITFKVEDKCDWTTVTVDYDMQSMTARITALGTTYEEKIGTAAVNGLSYLHIQTLAEEEDFEGTLIKSFRQTAL